MRIAHGTRARASNEEGDLGPRQFAKPAGASKTHPHTPLDHMSPEDGADPSHTMQIAMAFRSPVFCGRMPRRAGQRNAHDKVAYASMKLGIPAEIFVPMNEPHWFSSSLRSAIRRYKIGPSYGIALGATAIFFLRTGGLRRK